MPVLTLGIYGPKPPEPSGVANFSADVGGQLSDRFSCTWVSNDCWVAPSAFDHVLYHVGASRRHRCVFEALQCRPGPAIIHEHNCLLYYYEAWDMLRSGERSEFLEFVNARVGERFTTLEDVQAFLDALARPDRYAIDLQVEALFLGHVTGAVTHSPFVAELLRTRYPGTRVELLPFMARPFDRAGGEAVRAALGFSRGDFVFGTFGYLHADRRIDKVFEAWTTWSDRPPHVKLLVSGVPTAHYRIAIPPDATNVGYILGERDFEDHLAAVDCAIQLRHPSLGETSSVASKLVANGVPLIMSATEFTRPYEGRPRVTRISPEREEVPALQAAFRRVAGRGRTTRVYDGSHAPARYLDCLAELIRDSPPRHATCVTGHRTLIQPS